jgi:hypothetical protein
LERVSRLAATVTRYDAGFSRAGRSSCDQNFPGMAQKDLKLNLQSSHDALSEVVADLKSALEKADELEEEGARTPVPSGELERIIAQCQAVQRKLDQWQARL